MFALRFWVGGVFGCGLDGLCFPCLFVPFVWLYACSLVTPRLLLAGLFWRGAYAAFGGAFSVEGGVSLLSLCFCSSLSLSGPSSCFACLFVCFWLLPLVCGFFLSPCGCPWWRPGPVALLVPPSRSSRYLVALVTAWLPSFLAGDAVVLCLLLLHCLMATKASGPVWGSSLYTMLRVLLGCSVLPR